MSHRIRLAAPWAWEMATDQQLLRLTRHFHRPSGLNPQQPVWLCWETSLSLSDAPTTLVNESVLPPPLAPPASNRVDISSLLRPHNTIELVFRLPSIARWPLPAQTSSPRRNIFNPSPDTPWLAAVWLEIDDPPQDPPRSSADG